MTKLRVDRYAPPAVAGMLSITMPPHTVPVTKLSTAAIETWDVDGTNVVGLVVDDKRYPIVDEPTYKVSDDAKRFVQRQLMRVQIGISQIGVDLTRGTELDEDPRAQYVRKYVHGSNIDDTLARVEASMKALGVDFEEEEAKPAAETADALVVNVTVNGMTFPVQLDGSVKLEVPPIAVEFMDALRQRVNPDFTLLPTAGNEQLVLYVFTGVVNHTGEPAPVFMVFRVPYAQLRQDVGMAVESVLERL